MKAGACMKEDDAKPGIQERGAAVLSLHHVLGHDSHAEEENEHHVERKKTCHKYVAERKGPSVMSVAGKAACPLQASTYERHKGKSSQGLPLSPANP